MSIADGVQKAGVAARKPGGALLVFLPVLIVLIGAVALVLAQMPRPADVGTSGYGIDEIVTGAVANQPR
jgi:hypothetical protein